MPFRHHDRIRFEQTDAAGVVYFAQILSLCHAAYEESLAQAGIPLAQFFSPQGLEIVPIIRAEISFRQPLYCGDLYGVEVDPQPINEQMFRIQYRVWRIDTDRLTGLSTDLLAATALTEHICLDPATRQRQALSPMLQDWIQAIAEIKTDDKEIPF